MNSNIKYIEENYIELRELCKLSNISLQKLNDMILQNLLPDASYTVTLTSEINSPLGDSIMRIDKKKYFPRSIIGLIDKNKKLNNSSEFKKSFKSEFRKSLENHPNKEYAYGNILARNGEIDESKLDLIFEEEWNYYCQGIYGICTLNASGLDISHKEIAVKRIIDFNENHENKKLNKSEKEILEKLNTEFNNVSSLFAPYQRKNSSRGKYLDKILKSNSMDELIKKYR